MSHEAKNYKKGIEDDLFDDYMDGDEPMDSEVFIIPKEVCENEHKAIEEAVNIFKGCFTDHNYKDYIFGEVCEIKDESNALCWQVVAVRKTHVYIN